MKQIAAGIIKYNGKILIAQRRADKALGGFWEFPGGKQEMGESLEQCLMREIEEEFDKQVVVDEFFMQTKYDYKDFEEICLNFFLAHTDNDNIAFHPDHDNALWVTPKELKNYRFCPADQPVIEALTAK